MCVEQRAFNKSSYVLDLDEVNKRLSYKRKLLTTSDTSCYNVMTSMENRVSLKKVEG